MPDRLDHGRQPRCRLGLSFARTMAGETVLAVGGVWSGWRRGRPQPSVSHGGSIIGPRRSSPLRWPACTGNCPGHSGKLWCNRTDERGQSHGQVGQSWRPRISAGSPSECLGASQVRSHNRPTGGRCARPCALGVQLDRNGRRRVRSRDRAAPGAERRVVG